MSQGPQNRVVARPRRVESVQKSFNKMSMGKNFPVLLSVLFIIAFAVGILLRGAISPDRQPGATPEPGPGELFYAGVSIDGMDMGGKSFDQAQTMVQDHFNQIKNAFPITILADGRKFVMRAEDVLLTLDSKAAIDRAWDIGRIGSKEARQSEIARVKLEGARFTSIITYDSNRVRAFIRTVADNVTVSATDAAVTQFNPIGTDTTQWWAFSGEKDGRTINTAELEKNVLTLLENQQYGQTVTSSMQVIKPNLTLSMIQSANQLVSSYKTRIIGDSNRDINIDVASKAVSGSVVLPGETFSFNATTGPRLKESGYVDANIIVEGSLVPDPGGGVCQVAGTLYNAVVMADLEIVERHNHTLVSLYIPEALDATVFYNGNKDFRFKNNKDTPVYIVRVIDRAKRTITMQIYGAPLKNGITIKTMSEITAREPAPTGVYEQLDKKLKPGQRELSVKARPGTRATAYKVVYDASGKEIARTVLSKDYYPPTKQTWKVGALSTPGPSGSPKPSATPVSSAAPKPTPTAKPTAVPTPSPKP